MDTAAAEFHASSLYIEDTPALRLSDIQREARNLRREKGSIGLICIDYLTLMEAEKADRNDLAYGMITKGLKNLAKELNCVVILLTQLNRGLENRPDKRPMPSDSRDTGQIEQDVDLWIGLYKDSVYNEGGQHQGLTELIVRLNRHGGVGTGFVEMKEGYHLPLTTVEGTKMENIRSQEANKAEAEQTSQYKIGKKAKQPNNNKD
jgi:replicative DNA helicase